MKSITSITEIAADYDGFIIDLWGVMHDGSTLYPGAADALAYLHSLGKASVFLSNAPRVAERAEVVLDLLGIPRAQYHSIITSGQVAHDTLKSGSSYGLHYYYLGPSKDEAVLEGTACIEVDDPANADFILNAGFEIDFQPEDDILPTLKALYAHKLPLICINPDLEVVKQDGTRMLCAGYVARIYQQLGGKVEYFGKPYAAVYDAVRATLSLPESARLLAIGDNLLTDIKGANNQGIDSLLITGGILSSEHGGLPDEATLRQLFTDTGATPTAIAQRFAT